ncbi:MAG: M23 family metallopeptidase [Polyangiales bacterium]
MSATVALTACMPALDTANEPVLESALNERPNVGACRAHPLPGARVNSAYGERVDPFTGDHAFHNGIDLHATTGEPVRSWLTGVVVFSGSTKSCGNKLVVQSGPWSYKYCHLSRIYFKRGQPVLAGEFVAEAGSTGRSTGPHLHWEVFYKGERVNPDTVMATLDRAHCTETKRDAALAVGWQRRDAQGRYTFTAASAQAEVASVEYYIDGEVVAAQHCQDVDCTHDAMSAQTKQEPNGAADTRFFRGHHRFPAGRRAVYVDARGYDGQGQQVARGIATLDVASSNASYVRQLSSEVFETGLEQLDAGSDIAALSVAAEGQTLGVVQRNAQDRLRLRYSLDTLRPHALELSALDARQTVIKRLERQVEP